MDNILYISNVAGKRMSYSFVGSSLEAAHALGLSFYIAANREKATSADIAEDEEKYGVKLLHIDLARSPFSFRNIKAYRQLCRIIRENHIDYIHCNTPVGGLLGRLAGKRCKVKKIIYQAHGFHFYKGAPKKNWLVYYPIEKWLARKTDILITINHEDFALAKEKLKLRKGGTVYYVPGVGVNLERMASVSVSREEKRAELGIPTEAPLLLSVGELNQNKNHETVIRAIAEVPDVHYIIAGKGDKLEALEALAASLKIQDRVHFLGFRKDVLELYAASDVFVFPSFREGLSVALMEAMGMGLPVACGAIRGNTDLIDENGGALFDPHSVDACRESIRRILSGDPQKMGAYNKEKVKAFSLDTVITQMTEIYQSLTEGNQDA